MPKFPAHFTARIRPAQRAFTLMELMVVTIIVASSLSVSTPVIGAMLRDSRLTSAVSLTKTAMQQARLVLASLPANDVAAVDSSGKVGTHPFAGTALVVRWDQTKGDYEVFSALHVPGSAKDATGATLESMSPAAGSPNPYKGYARVADLEPMTLGAGVRVAGLRRNDASTSKLELVTGSFAVCFTAAGSVAPAQQIYVNLQSPPPNDSPTAYPGQRPWRVWDISGMYNPATYNESAAVGSSGQGEGFATALPMLVVYLDDLLPHDEAGAHVYRLADGSLNPALDPNELLRVTKGRMVMMSLQEGSTYEF